MPHDVRLLVLLIFAVSSTQGVAEIAQYCCGYQLENGPYTGAMTTTDVYAFPNLKKGKEIVANILVAGSHYHGVQSGWEINPEYYGDSKTHFYVSWTTDGTDGCANLECDGFVHVNPATITPGDTLEPSNGQKNIALKIFKSEADGNWWLYFGHDITNLSAVGYWPKSLLTNMQDGAVYVAWGGCVASENDVRSPPMGSGQWPGSESAASFSNVQLADMGGRGYEPPGDTLHAFESGSECYHIGVFRFDVRGNMFYYGGPGGCTS